MSHFRSISVCVLSLALVSVSVPGCAGSGSRTTHAEDLPAVDRAFAVPGQNFVKVFDNGLTLNIIPDKYTRLVQFDVRQEVGSRDDPPGKAGMAHFVEHLMFQMPADGPGSPKVMSDLPRHALSFNAFTAADITHYMHTGTKNELERYMKYTALRLGYDCASVEEPTFFRERDVVRNEHRWRGEGVEAMVFNKISEMLFPPGHPYRRDLLAGDAELASITPEDACAFIGKYYTPSQATVVVTGDVDPYEVLELAKKYLEPLPKVEPAQRKPVTPPTFAAQRAKIEAPVKKPTAVILFQTPKRFTRDDVAAQASLQTLFLSVSFFTNKPQSFVKRWYGVPPLWGDEAPVWGIAVETKKAKDLGRAVDEVLNAIERGFSADVKGKDHAGSYDAARQLARLEVLDALATIGTRALTSARYLAEANDPGMAGAQLAALDALTAEQAHAVGRRIFDTRKAMVVEVLPDGTADEAEVERAEFDYEPNEEEKLAVPGDIDPEEAKRPLPLEDIEAPAGKSLEYKLPNGMRVVLVNSSQFPVMDVQLIVGAGTVDAGDHQDVATVAARLYGPREGSREAANLMNFANLAGIDFHNNVSAHATTYRARGLSAYLDFLLAGMAEQVVQAEYQTRALEQWKERRGKDLGKASARQAAERHNLFNEALYGKDHPHVQREISSPDRLREIKLSDVEEFRRTHWRAANSAIIVTGGFAINVVARYIDAFFAKPKLHARGNTWQEASATPVRTQPPEPNPGSIRTMIEVDAEKVQTNVRIAYPLREVYGDDHAALLVMADMLNFGVSRVRQELGASYGVYAGANAERPQIFIGGALDSARAGEALAAIRAEVQKLRDGEDFDRRFAFARRNVLTKMINTQADRKLLASQLAEAVRNGRSYDYFKNLARQVAALTPEQVRAQIASVLRDERSVTLLQGPREGLQKALEHNGITDAYELPEAVHDEDE